MKLFYILVTLLILVTGAYARSEKEKFESAFADLKRAIKENQFLSTYTHLPEYKVITDMGYEVAPYIIEKMQTDADGFHLSSAMRQVSKRSFVYEPERKKLCQDGGSQALAKIYVTWWNKERELTPNLFKDYYKKWHESKELGDQDSASLMLLKIEALGIEILPLLYETENFHSDFFPIICRLTNGDVTPCLNEAWKKYWEGKKGTFILSENKSLTGESVTNNTHKN
jgi:hypothetical protein